MIVHIEGFEQFGAAGSGDPVGMDARYTVQNISFYSMVSGRFSGGVAIEVDGAGSARAFRTANLVAGDTITIGFAFWNGGANATRDLVNLYDGNGSLSINLRLLSTNEFELRRNTTQLEVTTGQASTNAWHYLELKVVCGNSPSGSYEFRIDGVNVMSDSGLDTQAGSSAVHASVEFCACAPGARYDDIYIADDGTFRGDLRVFTLFPSSAGDSAEFVPSSGDNYAAVDESGHDGDTSYCESSTPDDTDTHHMTNVSGIGDILAVQHSVVCRKTDVTNFDIELGLKIGGTEYFESPQTVGSTSFTTKSVVLEESPATTDPFTPTELNALQAGYKVG